MVTEAINHDPAHTFMNTGTTISGRPAMGSWINYGLGSESDDLPGIRRPDLRRPFRPGPADRVAAVAQRLLAQPVSGCAVLLQGRSRFSTWAVPHGTTADRQRDVVDAVRALDSIEDEVVDDPEIATRIAAYETAFRMQTSVPELIDLSNEPKHILDMYGTQGADGSFGANCLLARRLAERGVRFIQLYHRDWDHHGVIKEHVKGTAAEVDQGAAALIKDLKQRGMLDETLVIWGGEFGRTPMAQGNGRDHHIKGFSIWMAGGGIKGGITHGADRRIRLFRRARRRSRPRPARHDPGPLRHRPQEARLPHPGPRLPAHRRRRPGRQVDPGVSQKTSRTSSDAWASWKRSGSQSLVFRLFRVQRESFAGVGHSTIRGPFVRRRFDRWSRAPRLELA